MKPLHPTGSQAPLPGEARILLPPLIDIIGHSVGGGCVNHLWHGVHVLAYARLALDYRFLGPLARGNVGVRDDGSAALAAQRRYRHQEPALLVRRVAGTFDYEIGARAVQHRLNADQRRPPLAVVPLLGAAADVQVVDAYAVGNGVAAVFPRETFPGLVDGNDVSITVEQGDVGRKRVEGGLVERLALTQRSLCAFALSDVGGYATNGVRPSALVPERKLDCNEVVRPVGEG